MKSSGSTGFCCLLLLLLPLLLLLLLLLAVAVAASKFQFRSKAKGERLLLRFETSNSARTPATFALKVNLSLEKSDRKQKLIETIERLEKQVINPVTAATF